MRMIFGDEPALRPLCTIEMILLSLLLRNYRSGLAAHDQLVEGFYNPLKTQFTEALNVSQGQFAPVLQ